MISAQEEKGFSRQPLWEQGPGGVLRAQRVRTGWKAAVSDMVNTATPTPADAAAREEFVKIEGLDCACPFRKVYFLADPQGFTVYHFQFALRFWCGSEEVLSIPLELHSSSYPSSRFAMEWPQASGTEQDCISVKFQHTGSADRVHSIAPRNINITCDKISVKIVSWAGTTYADLADLRIFLACQSTNYTG